MSMTRLRPSLPSIGIRSRALWPFQDQHRVNEAIRDCITDRASDGRRNRSSFVDTLTGIVNESHIRPQPHRQLWWRRLPDGPRSVSARRRDSSFSVKRRTSATGSHTSHSDRSSATCTTTMDALPKEETSAIESILALVIVDGDQDDCLPSLAK